MAAAVRTSGPRGGAIVVFTVAPDLLQSGANPPRDGIVSYSRSLNNPNGWIVNHQPTEDPAPGTVTVGLLNRTASS